MVASDAIPTPEATPKPSDTAPVQPVLASSAAAVPSPDETGTPAPAAGDEVSSPRAWILAALAVLAVLAVLAWTMRNRMTRGPVPAAVAPPSEPSPAPLAVDPAALTWSDLSDADRAAFEQAARDLGLGGHA